MGEQRREGRDEEGKEGVGREEDESVELSESSQSWSWRLT